MRMLFGQKPSKVISPDEAVAYGPTVRGSSDGQLGVWLRTVPLSSTELYLMTGNVIDIL